jgi:DNA/RNA non-specific endonuclease
MPVPAVPYPEILAAAKESGEDIASFLREELPYCWKDYYLSMTDRPSEILVFAYETFDYIFDAYQQTEIYDPSSGKLPIEARLVAAIGTSKPKRTKRDDGRLRGLTVSPMPGPDSKWDRGHFIAHSIGGTVDGNEANVFPQLRSVNRGRYRIMENYCRKNAGVTCFSRPIYADTSAHPTQIEFGVLKTDGELWVEVHPNRPDA